MVEINEISRELQRFESLDDLIKLINPFTAKYIPTLTPLYSDEQSQDNLDIVVSNHYTLTHKYTNGAWGADLHYPIINLR